MLDSMNGIPIGGIVLWPAVLDAVAPLRRCDGSDAGGSADLDNLLAGRFGKSDQGSSLLPDLLGRFVRGAGHNDVPGTEAGSSFQSHGHGYNNFPADTDDSMVAIDDGSDWRGAESSQTSSIAAAAGLPPTLLSDHESRPVNVYLHFLISDGETE